MPNIALSNGNRFIYRIHGYEPALRFAAWQLRLDRFQILAMAFGHSIEAHVQHARTKHIEFSANLQNHTINTFQ